MISDLRSPHARFLGWLMCIALTSGLLALQGCRQDPGGSDTAQASPYVNPKLSWSAPATREDGSRLYPGEISGYRLYYRLRHQSSFQTITLQGAETTQFSLDRLRPGAYEFSVTTIDSDGLESRRSGLVSVDVI